MKHSSTPKTALVTGASSGIGYEIARLFAADGHNLVLVGRSEDELAAIAEELEAAHAIKVTVIIKDLFELGAATELYDVVRALDITVNYLVNDAGQGVYGRFVHTDLARELDIIQLNVTAVVVLTKLFLRDMVARDEGRILQLGSVVSKIPSPLQAVYAGTKAFIYNFTESLINELKDSQVTITLLRPGATDTDFFHKAGANDARMVQEGHLAAARKVARDGYAAMMRGKEQVVSGLGNRMQDMMGNLLPPQLLAERMRRISEPMHGGMAAASGTRH